MIVLLLACAPDLLAGHDWDDGVPLDTSDPGSRLGLIELGTDAGAHTARVDARYAAWWVHLDLDGPQEIPPDAPGWDLRLSRFHISANGGISGDEGVEVVFDAAQRWTDELVVPETGWRSDAPDGPDEDDDPDYALFTWYDYDEATHILTPAPGVWFVRSSEAAVYALQVRSYYDENGSSAVLELVWRGPLAGT